ncbi:hypothetical protein D3C79_1003400 [compost metagenome]
MTGVAAHPVVPRHGEAGIGRGVAEVEQPLTALERFRAGIGLHQLGEVGHIHGDPGEGTTATTGEAGQILAHDVVHQYVVAIDEQVPWVLARQVAQ